ncbi:MAG: putative ABC transporter permease [Lachnospira sp.]|nr:putative ABC transporter permease [Lachnospira sp.]
MNLSVLTFHEMNLSQLALWFFIYSFCGWCMECVVIRIQLGYWENRGFAKLPFCVIYGFGTYIAFHIFAPIEHNYVLLYIFGCICATAFEYLTAQIMLKLFGEVWWNYEHLPFNYKGILCLESTLAWGLLAIFIFGFFNRVVEGFLKSINSRAALMIAVVLTVSYVLDFAVHFSKGMYAKNTQRQIANNQDESDFAGMNQKM